jgi:hypothetical protein
MRDKFFHDLAPYKSAGDERVPRIAVAAATSGLTR